jgi:hypothetical protein
MNPLIQFRTTILPLFIAFALACFGLSPRAQALNPPPDGGYANATTAEGKGALSSVSLRANNNTALGFDTLFNDTSGSHNTATGSDALFDNLHGSSNTATGASALFHNTDGNFNTATGASALFHNTGDGNTADGFQALFQHTTEGENTAVGFKALFSGTNISSNTAIGYRALFASTGNENTATGSEALASGGGPGANTADGFQALFSDSIGESNTATGYQALYNNVFGDGNTAVGSKALFSNSGSGANSNTAIGEAALISNINGSHNTAIGDSALDGNTTGSGNIALGSSAGFNVTAADNVICIGATGANVSNSCYIGQIFGATSSGGTAVYINSDGKLGTTTSSRRFKEEIKPMDKASEAIHALKPVTFRYKKEIDPDGTPQFGLVAEDVATVNPDLVVRDGDGKVYTVRYEAVNAMLLNEFLKEHQKVQKLEAALAAVNERLKEQDAKIDKVNAKVEMSRPAPQTVVDNH